MLAADDQEFANRRSVTIYDDYAICTHFASAPGNSERITRMSGPHCGRKRNSRIRIRHIAPVRDNQSIDFDLGLYPEISDRADAIRRNVARLFPACVGNRFSA
jgi:hypothetical protein